MGLARCGATPSSAEAQIQDVEGRAQVSWEEADKVLDQTAFVYGKVIDVNDAGRITFLNFDANRPAKFSAVIFDANLKNFPTPPAALYAGKIVRIRGRVDRFRDSTEIVVAKPEQVEVLATMPTSILPAKPAPRARPSLAS